MWGTSQLTRNIERQVELAYTIFSQKQTEVIKLYNKNLEQVYQFYNMQLGHNF